MKSTEIRRKFIDFFAERGHRPVPSASLIPRNDPTLLFTNAGMVPFKAVFLGEESREYRRAVSAQKCVRAGGKHNDLENVGRTARHHTFFEMLGNFSFGDYFKREAIRWGWEFLTGVMGLPKEKLWISIYLDDDEAAELWQAEAGVPADRIVRLGEKDNFWSMGDTGPCGPCSEIHIDQGPEAGCGRPDCAVGACDCDRFLELWNLVFMQYNRDASGSLTPLPRPSIDTGMGLERLSAVMQGRKSNFDSDLFRPLIQAVEKISGRVYGESAGHDVSMRVIADHMRSTTFLLADGLLPGNEGRGYVLRRIIRRAARHGKMLGLDGPFLFGLVGEVVELMGGSYPELPDSAGRVEQILRVEEQRFSNTLRNGLSVLEGLIAEARAEGRKTLAGADLFRLYDTYGFPLDLAGDVAADAGLGLDTEGFDREMEAQKARARASWVGADEAIAPEYRRLAERLDPTLFTGYDGLEGEATVLALFRDGRPVERAEEGETVEIFTDRTPFYAEGGGQVGDRGRMQGEGVQVEVLDTKKPVDGLIGHHGRIVRGRLEAGLKLRLLVDATRRRATMRHHTATHLLQSALRELLGDHVKQAGSLVAPDRLRFDFTHFAALSRDEILRIEDWVNDRVLENLPVEKQEMSIDEALAAGATALFGEKYGERVRVVRAGEVSAELCGGTHVEATGEIGLFKILGESSVASGVRRIEALTGRPAVSHLRREEAELEAVAELLKTRDDIAERLRRVLSEAREAEKELEALKAKMSASRAGDLLSEAREIEGVKALAASVDGLSRKDLLTLSDSLRDRLGSGIVLLASKENGRAALVVSATKDLAGGRLHAGNVLREVAARVGAKGGGRPDMAQGGLKDASRLSEALAAFYEVVAAALSG